MIANAQDWAYGGGARRPRKPLLMGVYLVLLLSFSVYVLLDAFVIVRSYATAVTADLAASATATKDAAAGDTVVSDALDALETSQGAMGDGSQAEAAAMSVAAQQATTSLTEYHYADTSVYVVDIYASDVTQLLAAFAQDTYGKNVTTTTSSMASQNNASVAINGDYYGARSAGYVVRNGVLYRDTMASADQEDLVIYADGSFQIVCEGEVSAQELVDAGAWQVFSFGPGLVEDGTVLVDDNDEVGHAMSSNPRTALGKVSDGHYVMVVTDGRTDESEGLSLLELATFMCDELGVECAYNLDGGGSSTLWYQGEVINNPTTNGRSIKERSVSDIVYLS